MKISLILFLGLFLAGLSYGQSDTIRLQKIEHEIYRCTNPNARSWYLFKEEDQFYLVNLAISEEEIESWFKRYNKSQNIYKSSIIIKNKKEFFIFKKDNFLEELVTFEILRRNSTEILTRSMQTGEEFGFAEIGF